LNLHSALRLGLLQEFLGDYDAALAIYRNILRMNPDYPAAHAYRARVKVLQDKPDSALRESEKETNPFWGRYARILALSAGEKSAEEAGEIAGQQSDEARALLDDMIEEDGHAAAFQIAELLAFRNEQDRAFGWIDRAHAQRDKGIASTIGNRLLENLHSDPRWAAWLQRLSLPDQP
jgi:tetratricopeptide (TPR) repeat protein